MNAPCAIEYILVTRWRGGKKGGQNRVCACDTRDRGVNKKLKPEHPSETVVMPESGERKRNLRNLTTLFFFFFFLVSRTRHHSCAGHCFTIRSHCNFFRNATIPPGRIKQQKKTKQTAPKQNQQRNTNQTQTENQTPEWKLSSLFLYNVQLK